MGVVLGFGAGLEYTRAMNLLRPLTLACLLLAPPAWAGTLYKCTGADGSPNYTGKKVAGA
ncbi:MAG TPA: DUF4124 domain-containing protein, partial [Arenimonas sp.]|uniref:DUF4124 domain-containing protein n=1 Tax=Arenimonas sp. TaxID=1872635 RepID=UPI002D7E4F4A